MLEKQGIDKLLGHYLRLLLVMVWEGHSLPYSVELVAVFTQKPLMLELIWSVK